MSDKQINEDDLDRELRELDLFEPSMRFSKNVLEQVKAETGLLKPERGPLYWVPRACIASVILVLGLLVYVLSSPESGSLEVELNEQLTQLLMIASWAIGGILAYLLLDKLFNKLIAG